MYCLGRMGKVILNYITVAWYVIVDAIECMGSGTKVHSIMHGHNIYIVNKYQGQVTQVTWYHGQVTWLQVTWLVRNNINIS